MVVLGGGIAIEVFRGLDREGSAIGKALEVLREARYNYLQGGLSMDAVW
jgi:hypothetical protein